MKAHVLNGAGNAFVLLDARGTGQSLSVTSQQVAAILKRQPFDQLLGLEDRPGHAARMRVWNADGGEVGACGNGARAAAWLLFEEGEEHLTLDSLGGPLSARKLSSGLVEVDLGKPRLDWRDIPLEMEMDTVAMPYTVEGKVGECLSGPGAVSMGNPHVVFQVRDIEALPLKDIGPRIEHDPLFPDRVNAGFAEIRDRNTVRLRVWERGAGLTQACGTGAAACVVALSRQGKLDREADIIVDGGTLHVRWNEAGNHVYLSGPVEYEGEIDLSEILGS